MAISPNRAEARLAASLKAETLLNDTEAKARSLAEEQDQRQVQVTLLDNQISDLKARIIPTTDDAPPNAENAAFQATIDGLEKEKAQIVVVYGEASVLLNKLGNEMDALRNANPFIERQIVQQREALALKQAAYPRLLLRHLRKCKAHGWTDARMGKLSEHKTNLRAERREMEAKLGEKITTSDFSEIEARVAASTPTKQLAEALRR